MFLYNANFSINLFYNIFLYHFLIYTFESSRNFISSPLESKSASGLGYQTISGNAKTFFRYSFHG